jgi:hypothetical protein
MSERREPSEAGQHEELHDLTGAVEGLGCEVEALNMTLRELLSVAEVGLDLDPPPSWVNEAGERYQERSETMAELRRQYIEEVGPSFATEVGPSFATERGWMGSSAALVLISAFVVTILTFLGLLYVIGG